MGILSKIVCDVIDDTIDITRKVANVATLGLTEKVVDMAGCETLEEKQKRERLQEQIEEATRYLKNK